jgi:hypothetical protein
MLDPAPFASFSVTNGRRHCARRLAQKKPSFFGL